MKEKSNGCDSSRKKRIIVSPILTEPVDSGSTVAPSDLTEFLAIKYSLIAKSGGLAINFGIKKTVSATPMAIDIGMYEMKS